MNVDDEPNRPADHAPMANHDPYSKEKNLAVQMRRYIESARDIPAEANDAFLNILAAYETLLDETGLLTRSADKFNLRQKRLNEKLKKQYEELKTTQARLQQTERMASLSLIVSGVAHEVNTPIGVCITAMSYWSDSINQFDRLYRSGQVKKSDLESYLSRSREVAELFSNNLNRAAELITSFKQVSVDQLSQKRRTFDLRTAIQESLNSLGHLCKNGSQTISLDCPGAITMDSFPGALSQVIINLVMNAHIHAFGKTGNGHISISANAEIDQLTGHGASIAPDHATLALQPAPSPYDAEGESSVRCATGTVTLKLADNGKGIPQENLKQIFDPFFTTQRGLGGSGLGLHIVYNTVTGPLCGSIEVESTEGRGTCFTLRIPLTAHDDSDSVIPFQESQKV
jgi:two-component system NtrC family sensor kinase